MIFQRASITTAGRDLIARAIAGSTIIWGKCGCYSEDLNSATQGEINEKETLTGEVATGGASAVFEMEAEGTGRAKIKCQVNNESEDVSAGFAKTFGLWAKIQGDAEEVLVVIAVTGEHQPTYFPECTDATTRLIGLLDMTIAVQTGAASTISIISSLYALASDLQEEIDAREALAGRVVTCHKEGQTTAGDDQTVYGKKTFENEMTVGKVMPNGRLGEIGDPDNQFQSIHALIMETGVLSVGQIHKKEDETGVEVWAATKIRGDLTITGTDGTGVGNVNANITGDVTGRIPRPQRNASHTSRPTIPLGAIVMLCVMNDSEGYTAGDKIDCGVDLNAGGGTNNGLVYTDLYVANINTETHAGSNSISMGIHTGGSAEPIESGTFRTLNHGSTSVSTNKIFVLAIKVAD